MAKDQGAASGIDGTTPGRLINEFISARKHPALAVLEGFHPLKHALRFDAAIVRAVTNDKDKLLALARRLAPDVAQAMAAIAHEVDADLFARLAPRPPKTGVIALARRRAADGLALLAATRTAPLVFLERPSHLGNVGAVVRVAAGAGAAGVVTSGIHDPWGPDALRGGAGLQFALPVGKVGDDRLPTALSRRQGPLLALDPEGDELTPSRLPSDAIVAFGSERSGLTDPLLRQADGRIAIPMMPGVSSLNLATSVAVVLYTWRLGQPTL